MNTKKIATAILCNFFIVSGTCFSMNYMRESYNTTTTKIATNLINARQWTNDFLNTFRLRFYALFRVNNLKTITGLDENKLDTYNVSQLDEAKEQIGKMITYSNESPRLNILYSTLQGKIISLQHAVEQEKINQDIENEINNSYDPEATEKDVELLLEKQRGNRQQ